MAKKKKESTDELNDILMGVLQNTQYAYQRPDYKKNVQPLVKCLLPLQEASIPSETLEAYAKAHDKMKGLDKKMQEQMLCNYLMNALKNPGTEEYEEMVGWLGGGFAPKAFNLTGARQRIDGYMQRIKNKK